MAHPTSLLTLLAASALLAGPSVDSARAQTSTETASPPADQADEEKPATTTVGSAALDLYEPQTERELDLLRRFTDTTVAVVGESIITQAEVLALVRNPEQLDQDPTAGRESLTDQQRFELLYSTALEQVIDGKLKAQGGLNLGYDPALIEAYGKQVFDQRVAALGGPTTANERFRAWGFTPQSFQDYLRQRLYAQFWEDAQTGRGIGPTGRAVVDSYVRPGRLHAVYRDIVRNGSPDARAVIGQKAATVTLERLVLRVPSVAEAESTLSTARAIRENIAKGVIDFDQAVRSYSQPQFQGEQRLLPDLPLAPLAERLHRFHGPDPAIDTFAEGPKVGDVSPALEQRRPDGLLDSVVVYRVQGVQPATDPLLFVDGELQSRLRESIQEQAAELQIARGLAGLARTTFVAPIEIRRELIRRGARVAR